MERMLGLQSLRVACVPLVGAGMLACSVGPAPSPERLERTSAAVSTCGNNVTPWGTTPLLIKNPQVYFVFWGSYWQSGAGATSRAQFQQIWSNVASSPSFWNRLAEYQIGLGSYAGSASNTSSLTLSGTLTEQQIQTELDAEITSGLLPKPNANTFYVLMLPPGVTDQVDVDNNYSAHHGYAPASGSVPATPYAVMPSYGQSGSLLSHEISEGATDPDLATGYRDTVTAGEIGDLCENGTFPIGAAGFPPGVGGLQRMWSQRDCGCVTRRDPGSADFNGDWRADLAVTGAASDLTSTEVGVALSNGGGAFAPTKLSTTDFNTYATQAGAVVLAGDFDGDGNADLAAVGVSSWNGVKVAYSHGDGTFGSTASLATSFGAAASAAGVKVVATDVNGDGYADLVATGAPGATTIAVARGQAGHTFSFSNAASSFASLVSAAGASFAAGDVNNDGYDDLVAVGTSSTTLTVALSNGDGTFKIVTSTNATLAAALAQAGAKLVIGDVDDDSVGDLVVTGAPGATKVTVGRSNGDGTFTPVSPTNGVATSFPGLAGTSGAVIVGGDFDGDMRPDVVATGVSSWTTVPMLTFVASPSGLGSYNLGFFNDASDFAGYAGQAKNRVASAIGYASAVVTSFPVRINAGGAADAPYVADGDFAGGSTIDHANTIDLSAVTNPAPAAVYQDARIGNFTYTIPAPAGSSHVVRLHFAETYFSTAGSRVFDVSINGAQVLTNFDVYKAAGAKDKAVVEAFTENANASGQYVIQCTSVVNNGLVSGIEID